MAAHPKNSRGGARDIKLGNRLYAAEQLPAGLTTLRLVYLRLPMVTIESRPRPDRPNPGAALAAGPSKVLAAEHRS